MTLTSKIIKTFFLTTVFLVGFSFSFAQTENSLTLSVSPTLFEMTANPTQEWTSMVRVINSNPYDITVYTDVVNFAPQGESGQAKFLPLLDEEVDNKTLAEWVKLENDEYTIPAEQTIQIPFKIFVPDDAPPGGHFGAILIGTKSLTNGNEQTAVETSQVVTALIFLRVTGDIVEDGAIREFRPIERVTEQPEMSFELRFQNKGNVHVLPQGEIKIFNMWGQERGLIPVNRQTMFGNVLPDSIRKYNFTWSGEWSLSDIGRYTALATLAYGDGSRQFVNAETSFWVLPWKIASLVLSTILGFVYIVTWAIRLYVRKMLKLAGVSPDAPVQHRRMAATNMSKRNDGKNFKDDSLSRTITKNTIKRLSVVARLEEGMLDLRNRMSDTTNWRERVHELIGFIQVYKTFFFVTAIIVIFIIGALLFVSSANKDRSYEVTIAGLEEDIKISSEEIEYENIKDIATSPTMIKEDFPSIKIINRSGVPGLAAEWRLKLEGAGFPIHALENELGSSEEKTVIVYDSKYTTDALALSAVLHGALLSANLEAVSTEPIVIYIGSDLKNAVE